MAFDFKKLSMMVVEDTEPMRKLVASVLDMLGVGQVFTADNGESGFALLRRVNPDIVIADWHMEPMDGIRLTKAIRTSPLSPNRLVPIILITGYSAAGRVGQARDAGVTEFLVKPFSANDLAKRLAHVINKPRDFIDAPGYFGPDRRRRNTHSYSGPQRRADDRKSPPGSSKKKNR